MTSTVYEVQTPDPVTYLDRVAAGNAGREYKARLLDELNVQPGQTVLDIGCGPGTDLHVLADAVTTNGEVIGLDRSEEMVARARQRLADRWQVRVLAGDAHALALADASVDRARADRVLMHLADPAGAVQEMHRVLRPGGLAALAEPDWDTLAIADEDLATSRRFTAYVSDGRCHGTVGRQLPGLLVDAGFGLRSVTATAVVLRDVRAADQLLGLRRNAERAVAAGVLAPSAAAAWLDRLATGTFFATVTFVTSIGIAQ